MIIIQIKMNKFIIYFYLINLLNYLCTHQILNNLNEYYSNNKYIDSSHQNYMKTNLTNFDNSYEYLKNIFDDNLNSICEYQNNFKQCTPSFKNIAQGVNVYATTTCGEYKSQHFCQLNGKCELCNQNSTKLSHTPEYLTDLHQITNQTCWISGSIEQNNVINLTISLGKRFEIFYLILEPCLKLGRLPDAVGIFKSSDFGQTWKPWHYLSKDCYRAFGLPTSNEYYDHITLTNLQEVICVAIKSNNNNNNNNNNTNSYYSSQFKMVTDSMIFMNKTHLNEFNDNSIIFNTILGRSLGKSWSPTLDDWMTVTDIRISLIKFQNNNYAYNDKPKMMNKRKTIRTTKWINDDNNNNNRESSHFFSKNYLPTHNRNNFNPKHKTLSNYPSAYYPNQRSTSFFDYRKQFRQTRESNNVFEDLQLPQLNINQSFIGKEKVSSSTSSSPTLSQFRSVNSLNELINEPNILTYMDYYAFSNLIIGGRCKCNGHAKECILGVDGKLICACEHNTAGTDCEYCKTGYMDRPWDRASENNANECKKCDCNLHSDECRFSNSHYLLSNHMSGGLCENCQHNTIGRKCHQCMEGFYRDWTKPLSHEHVCLPCRCHPIGSIVRHDCDRKSGQCRCKQGVTGLTCDRCQDGFHQTRSPLNPCTKDFASRAMVMAHTPVDMHCAPCSMSKERIKLKKFCRKDAVFIAYFKSRELHGDMAQFEMYVIQIWRLNEHRLKGDWSIYWPVSSNNLNFEQNDRDKYDRMSEFSNKEFVPVWVRLNDLRCKCPHIELGIEHLILTDFESFTKNGRAELMFSTRTTILPWQEDWKRRLTRFRQRENRGECGKFPESTKLLSVYRPKPIYQPSLSRQSTNNRQHNSWFAKRLNQPIKHLNHYDNPFYSVPYRSYSNYNRRAYISP